MHESPGNRRRFLIALAACLALPAAALSAKTPDTAAQVILDQFLQAGSNLTGVKVDDRDLARSYLALVRSKFDTGDVDTFLAANTGAKNVGELEKRPTSEIERFSMLLWLTGFSIDPAGGKLKILSYTGAAVWSALPFTKPPGQCGGAFGYWSNPPAASN